MFDRQWFLSCPTQPVHSDLSFLSTPNGLMVDSISWTFTLAPHDIHQPQGHCLNSPASSPLSMVHSGEQREEVWETCVILDTKTDPFLPLADTTCVQDCPEGYYADEDSHRCAPCHSSCRTCEGRHSMQCLSCPPGWFQLGKECLPQCREG